MSEQIYVKPAHPQAIMRHPEKLNHIIPPEGEWVMKTEQWLRYLRMGDVVLADPPSPITITSDEANKTKGGKS